MKYSYINEMDIYNGPGVRITLFIQGCEFPYMNTKNIHLKDFNSGKEFDRVVEDEVIRLCGQKNISGLTISGGEPFDWVPYMYEYYTHYSRKFNELYKNNIDGITIKDIKDYYDSLTDDLIFEINPIYHLVKKFKETYPDKTVWVYTGYSFNDLILKTTSRSDIAIGSEICLDYIDIIANCKYIQDGKDFEDLIKGNLSGKLIDVKRSLEHNEIITYNREASY